MLSIINTASLWGLEGHLVRVEIDVAYGLPAWTVVGLGDKTIREASERIKAAMTNSGYDYPRERITINLAPAGTPKEGSHFDLPAAVGLLAASGMIPKGATDGYAFIGELSLGGQVNRVKGVLPLVMTCMEAGIRKIVLPRGNCREAAMIADASLYPVERLGQVVAHFQGTEISPYRREDERKSGTEKTEGKTIDYDDIHGQDSAKRAMVICAAGAHGLLMMGSPGCGKSMLAQRLPGILPPLSEEERREVTRIYSVAGLLDEEHPVVERRPFRAPHQNITQVAMLGGGHRPSPGEFSLAHTGVLFMDEFSQFDRGLINALRQPLEEERVVIARKGGTAIFPGKMIFVAASNPCPCGWAGSEQHRCTCSPGQLANFHAKLSGPILDRIDMRITVPRVDLKGGSSRLTEEEMRKQVYAARKIQERRYRGTIYRYNSQLDPKGIRRFCSLDGEGERMMELAYQKMSLSMRTYHRIIKVARTIADMEGREKIEKEHIAEAIQYRREEHEDH